MRWSCGRGFQGGERSCRSQRRSLGGCAQSIKPERRPQGTTRPITSRRGGRGRGRTTPMARRRVLQLTGPVSGAGRPVRECCFRRGSRRDPSAVQKAPDGDTAFEEVEAQLSAWSQATGLAAKASLRSRAATRAGSNPCPVAAAPSTNRPRARSGSRGAFTGSSGLLVLDWERPRPALNDQKVETAAGLAASTRTWRRD